MDSLTQAALGAAVGEVILGKKLGWQAVAYGAFFGTLPDLDVIFLPFFDEADSLRWHRGFSHSIVMMVLASFLMARPLAKLWKSAHITAKEAGWFVFWAWSTHILIDCFTTYGTQIFEPFSDFRFTFNNLFIIDLFFTVPLLVGLVWIFRYQKEDTRRRRVMRGALMLASSYVAFSFGMKFWATRTIQNDLRTSGMTGRLVSVSTTPFNTILWRALIEQGDDYVVRYWSPFDKGQASYDVIPKQRDLAAGFEGDKMLTSLKWFSCGHWIARKSDGAVIIADMRFSEIRDRHGSQLSPSFQWRLTRDEAGNTVVSSGRPANFDYRDSLALIWERLLGQREAWEGERSFL